MAISADSVSTTMERVRDVVLDNYTYTLSVGNKVKFVEAMTNIISPIPLIAADKMVEKFEKFLLANGEYYDWWLNYCVQVITELDGGVESLESFLSEYSGFIGTLSSAEGFDLDVFKDNPQGIILLALRIYLEVYDKSMLGGK